MIKKIFKKIKHISDESLAAFINDDLTGQEKEKVKQHLQKCTECFEHLALLRKLVFDTEKTELPEVPIEVMQKANKIQTKSQNNFGQFLNTKIDNIKQIGNSILIFIENSIEYITNYKAISKFAYTFASVLVIGLIYLFVLNTTSPIENIAINDYLTISNDGPLGFVGDQEKIEYNGMEVRLSEDKQNLIFTWPKISNAQFYHIFLTNDKKQRITPLEGIHSNQFSYQIDNIEVNKKYIWEIIGQLENSKTFQAKAIFVRGR